MSNHYRKEEPLMPSRLDRLIEARVALASAAQLHADGGVKVQTLLAAEYKRRGGADIDSQIEGMLLVVEEGKVYRRAALKYAAEMEKFLSGERKDEPRRPEPGAVSPATMVSATRQFEKLEARRQAIIEDAELTVAAQLSVAHALPRQRREAEPHPDVVPQSEAKPAQATPEANPATRGDRAATAAA